MASSVAEKIKERRYRVLLGDLPEDFLRLERTAWQQEAADRQAAMALQQHYLEGPPAGGTPAGRFSVTVVQAKLAKNYGMTRMDPYARIRVGHCVYETHTDPNGGKAPRWNKVLTCPLPAGINTITVEIFDERSFTMDELIAWAQITIPQQVLHGETHEDWYPLSGKQGEGLEGMLNLVMSCSPYGAYMYGPPAPPPVVVVPSVGGGNATPLKVFTAPAAPTQVTVLSSCDLKQIEEMFPNIEKDVVKTVFEANRGNKDSTVNSLLQMSD